MKRTLLTAAIAVLAMGATPANSNANPGKAEIIHTGSPLVVSCRALNGHAAHADKKELISIKIASVRCRRHR